MSDDLKLPYSLNRKNWRNGKPPIDRTGGGPINPELLARAKENDPREMFVKGKSTPKRDYSAPANREIKPKRDAKTKATPKAKAKPKSKGGRKE
jgi:hypothetical protein